MKKVIIEFEYDETVDGELTPSDWDRIIEFLTQYGHDVKVRGGGRRMRLIDADKLLKFFTVDTANQTYRFGTVKKQIESAPTIKAIPLDKVKQAREEIENEIKFWSEPSKYNVKPIVAIKNAKAQSYKHCLEILDKLIAESEG